MKAPRPSKYVVEYIPLAKVVLPSYEAHDPDPHYEYEDVRSLRGAQALALKRVGEGVVGNRATIYRRYAFRYQHVDDSWDYSMEREDG